MIRASAILIDLDGTLVDSIPGLSEAARRMMVELGLPPLPQSEVETYVGKGIAKLVERVLTRQSDGKPDPDLFAAAMPAPLGVPLDSPGSGRRPMPRQTK